jgi:hypothetical protein
MSQVQKFKSSESRFQNMIGTYFQLFNNPERRSIVMEDIQAQIDHKPDEEMEK